MSLRGKREMPLIVRSSQKEFWHVNVMSFAVENQFKIQKLF